MLGRRRIIASHRPPGPRACVPNARAVHPLTHSQIFTHHPPPPSPLKVSSPGVSLVPTPPREPCISRGSSPVERCPCARSHPAPSIPTGRPARRRNATVHLPCPDLTRLFQVPGRFQQQPADDHRPPALESRDPTQSPRTPRLSPSIRPSIHPSIHPDPIHPSTVARRCVHHKSHLLPPRAFALFVLPILPSPPSPSFCSSLPSRLCCCLAPAEEASRN